VQRGLRARLQTGSLLTGQLFVELDMHPDTPVQLHAKEAVYPELPTIPAQMDEMINSVKTILAKMETLDIEQMGKEILGILKGTRKIVSGPEMEVAVKDFTAALGSFKQILAKVDQRAEPIAENLENALSAGQKALEKTTHTMGLLDKSLDPNSPLQFHLIELSGELSETARSIRALVDMLERNPNAVIFGKPAPEPKK